MPDLHQQKELLDSGTAEIITSHFPNDVCENNLNDKLLHHALQIPERLRKTAFIPFHVSVFLPRLRHSGIWLKRRGL